MYNYDHMSRTDWIGTGFMMVFVVILLVAIWAITQWMRTSDRPHLPADKSARDILDERFARREIEIEIDEYQDRRRVLDHLPVG